MPLWARITVTTISLATGFGLALVVKGLVWRTGPVVPLAIKGLVLVVVVVVAYLLIDHRLFRAWEEAFAERAARRDESESDPSPQD